MFPIRFGPLVVLLSLAFVAATDLSAQLIRTTEPIPSEAQILMHLESMMGTWEVESARKAQGRENGMGIIPSVPLNEEKLAIQLAMVQGEMEFRPGPRVKAYIKRYTRERRQETEALLGLTNAYSPLIDHEIRQRKLPKNLRYLPAALSAYNNLAVGDQGYAGLWQLPYHAALRYGLDCSAEVDERRDPIKSTRAALDYLEDLKTQYPTWELTILAYTCGAANVTKAQIRTEGNTDFQILYEFLPAFGRDYWPAFVALNYLGQYHRMHQLNPLQVKLPLQNETVPVNRELDLEVVAEVLDIPAKQLAYLNPTLREGAICIEGEQGELCLPLEYAKEFLAQEEKIYAKAEALNPPKPTEPEVEKEAPKAPERKVVAPKKPAIPANSVALKYIIQPGDNLGRIAQAHGVKVSQLQSWNGLSNANIRAGDELNVYVSKQKFNAMRQVKTDSRKETVSSRKPASGKSKTYTVKSGDTLWGISQKFEGVSAEEIMEVNNISEDIQPGQVLTIPAK